MPVYLYHVCLGQRFWLYQKNLPRWRLALMRKPHTDTRTKNQKAIAATAIVSNNAIALNLASYVILDVNEPQCQHIAKEHFCKREDRVSDVLCCINYEADDD